MHFFFLSEIATCDILTSFQFAIQREPTKVFLVDMKRGNKKVFLYFQPEDLTALKDQMKMLSAIVMELEEKSKQNKAWVSVTI